jgi:hypothetical protein
VTRTVRVREFVHVDLAGEPAVAESELLGETIEQVRCRWCDAVGSVELVPRADQPPRETAELTGDGGTDQPTSAS